VEVLTAETLAMLLAGWLDELDEELLAAGLEDEDVEVEALEPGTFST